MISKFQPCLPQDAEDRLLAERLLDLQGTLRFLATVTVNGSAPLRHAGGRRLIEPDHEAVAAIEQGVLRARVDTLAPERSIEWIDAPARLHELCAELEACPVVGLDVETGLDFTTLCLIQIATDRTTYVIDPLALVDLSPLARVLGGTSPVKLIHNARFERRVLALVGLALDGVVDTMELSKRRRGKDALGGHSLAMLCERELGAELDKTPQTSSWSRRPLEGAQLRYAALDAEVLLRLYAALGAPLGA